MFNGIIRLAISLTFFASINLFANKSFLQKDRSYNEKMPEMQDIGIEEHLGDQIDLSLEFTNEHGGKVKLSDYMNGSKPVLLTLIYYSCPSLCNFHLNGLTDVFKQMDWSIGNEFEVLAVSIAPDETPELAKAKKASYIKEYGRDGADKSWHFLTGKEEQIKKLASQVGFKYKWNPERKEWAHAAAAYVMSPTGMISRYLYGIGFSPKTLRLSLVEASNGKIGDIIDKFVLYCFQYDPEKKTYAFYALNIMRAGAGATVFILVLVFGSFWFRQKREIEQTTTKGDK